MNTKLNIRVESAPTNRVAEDFAFLLKELIDYTKARSSLDDVMKLCVQHREHFDVSVSGNEISIFLAGSPNRLLLLTNPEWK